MLKKILFLCITLMSVEIVHSMTLDVPELQAKFPSNSILRNIDDLQNFLTLIEQSQSFDLYKDLEISPSATQSEITKSYRKLALQWHPDKNQDNAAATEKLKVINQAYEILQNQEKRQIYDVILEKYYEQLRQKEFYAPLYSALTNGSPEDFAGVLRRYDSLPDNFLNFTIQQALETPLNDKRDFLLKFKSILEYNPDMILNLRGSSGGTLLHILAYGGLFEEINLLFDTLPDANQLLSITNNRDLNPLKYSIEAFLHIVQESWILNNSIITEPHVQQYRKIIEIFAQRTYEQCKNHQAAVTAFKNYVFDKTRWPYIGDLITNAGIPVDQKDTQSYEILRIVTPADCKVSYKPLVSFERIDNRIAFYSVAEVKLFAHTHGWDYFLFSNNKLMSLKHACVTSAPNLFATVVPQIPPLKERIVTFSKEFLTKTRFALLAGGISALCCFIAHYSIQDAEKRVALIDMDLEENDPSTAQRLTTEISREA